MNEKDIRKILKETMYIEIVKPIGNKIVGYTVAAKAIMAGFKKQLANIKYINKDNILDAIQGTELSASDDCNDFYIPEKKYDELIDKLMKLAYPKDRIIKVLINFAQQSEMRQGCSDYTTHSEQIYNEIIGGE